MPRVAPPRMPLAVEPPTVPLPRPLPRVTPRPLVPPSETTLTAMVHFDYDQSDLRPEDRAILDAKVPILTANPTVMIRVAGHTDERAPTSTTSRSASAAPPR
jgi:peptidoglycan-associated lipoprotein